MANKNEIEELEKWNTQRILNEKDKSKFYYEKFDKNKTIDRFSKVLKIIGIVLRIIGHIIVLIGIIIGLIFLYGRMTQFM